MKNLKYFFVILGGIVGVSLVVYLLGNFVLTDNTKQANKGGNSTEVVPQDGETPIEVGDPKINFSYFGVLNTTDGGVDFTYTSSDGSQKTVTLILNEGSTCDLGSGSQVCDEAAIEDGMNANVDGAQQEGLVTVSALMVVQI